MANTFKNNVYRSPKSLSYIVIGLLASLAVCAALYIVFSFVILLFPDAHMDLEEEGTMHIAAMLIGLVALLEIVLRIGTIVLFLIWLYRAFNNLSALKARNLEFSPGWAVGWWFVPFANLIKPFQVMRELWNESDPDFEEEYGFLSGSTGTPVIIIFWWAFFLISGILGRIADKMFDSGGETASNAFVVALILAAVFQGVAAVLAALIVRKITQRQEQRFQKVGIPQQFAPPQPPVFDQFSQN